MIYLVNPWTLVAWVLAAWVIAMLGRDKRFGFFGNFLISFLFSPLVGALVLLAEDRKPPPAVRHKP
ncbi:MAG TPA: hypothetical protein VGE72_07965 [Azospirillum sp.]